MTGTAQIMLLSLLLVGALAAGCSSSSTGDPPPAPDQQVTFPDASVPDSAADLAPTADQGPAPDLGNKAVRCTPPRCPACVGGTTGCAAKGPFLQGTCCARGDAVALLGTGTGSEVVDLETDGTFVALCGGFGADISDVSSPSSAKHLGTVTQRCQRAAFGKKLADGSRLLYIAHHGDSWLQTPFLATYSISTAGKLTSVDKITDATVLFEGMVAHGDALYVAAHDGGVRVYKVSTSGAPVFQRAITDGIKNAWKLAAFKDRLYVADQGAGLHVMSLAAPLTPKRLHTVKTTGSPRDVVVDGKRAYLAMGGGGVEVYDLPASGVPKRVGGVSGNGSAQAVAVSNGVLAVANWTHVSVHDAATLTLLGTERVRKSFEQDTGVAMSGNTIFVGEWEGLYVLRHVPGLVAPDIFVTEDIFTLDPSKKDTRAVKVQNLGLLELKVSAITTSESAFTIKNSAFSVAPGKAEVFEFSFTPPATSQAAVITLKTNDPDARQSSLDLPVELKTTTLLNVGDTLTSDFGFLDPLGSGQVSALKGKVLVLSYFALF